MTILGPDVAGQLGYLRAEAESLMVDTCTIRRPGVRSVWDESLERTVTTGSVPFYDGKCRIRTIGAGARADIESAIDMVQNLPVTVNVPWTVHDVDVGDLIRVTSVDSYLFGRQLVVRAAPVGPLMVHRRVVCDLEQGGPERYAGAPAAGGFGLGGFGEGPFGL